MKRLLKRFLARAVRNDRLWSMLDATLLQTARFLEWERQKNCPDPLEVERRMAIDKHCSDLIVKHGPFRGMKFPTAEAATGSLLPKLLGTYELELHPILESLDGQRYDQVVNIGAGEGYYAVGLALRCPQSQVFAYDTNPLALTQCASMARENGVGSRVVLGASFTRQMLMSLPTARTLIVCDCEGYEKQLFDRESVAAISQHDVLIEVHDFVDWDISTQLQAAFAQTHRLQVIPAIGNLKRVRLCDLPELAEYSREQRMRLISDDRNFEMEWYWFTPS